MDTFGVFRAKSIIQTVFNYIAMRVQDNWDKYNDIINPVSTHACNLSKECNILTPYHMWYGFKMVGNFCKKILKAHMLKRAQLESKNSLRGGLEPVQKLFKVFMLLWSYVMEKLIISCFVSIFGLFVDIFGPLRDPQISYFCGNMNYLYLVSYIPTSYII